MSEGKFAFLSLSRLFSGASKLAVCAFIAAPGAPAQASEASELVLATGAVGMREVIEKVRKPFEAESGLKVSYYGKESKELTAVQVLAAVDSGECDGGLASGYWKSLVDMMGEKKYAFKDFNALKYRILAYDNIQIMTDKAGPKKLSLEQIKQLLSGDVTNWKAITGEDLPVKIHLYSAQLGITVKFMKDRVLGGKDVKTEGAAIAASSTKMVEAIGAQHGSIGFGSLDMITPSVQVPEYPAISRPLTFVSKGQPSEKMLKLLNFIQKHGKEAGVILGG
jgi:phosphate transport system substrate-binding protein